MNDFPRPNLHTLMENIVTRNVQYFLEVLGLFSCGSLVLTIIAYERRSYGSLFYNFGLVLALIPRLLMIMLLSFRTLTLLIAKLSFNFNLNLVRS